MRQLRQFFCPVMSAIVLMAAGVSAHEIIAGTITIEHPWIASVRSSKGAAVGYVIGIKNTGDAEDRLVSAALDGGPQGVIRRKDAGAYQNLPGGLPIPPHGEISLAPGETQIFFGGIQKSLAAGGTVKGALVFAKAGAVAIEFNVEPPELAAESSTTSDAGQMQMDHGHHSH